MILTLGYLLSGYLLMALNATVIHIIMNNMVTMMIGADNTHVTYKPENWNIDRMAKISMLLASGWTLIGCLLVWFVNDKLGFTQDQVGTMVYVYCVLSAMLIVLMTRTRTYFWQSHSSHLVNTVQIIDVALIFAPALPGIAMIQVSTANLGLAIIVSLINAMITNLVYRPITKNR